MRRPTERFARLALPLAVGAPFAAFLLGGELLAAGAWRHRGWLALATVWLALAAIAAVAALARSGPQRRQGLGALALLVASAACAALMLPRGHGPLAGRQAEADVRAVVRAWTAWEGAGGEACVRLECLVTPARCPTPGVERPALLSSEWLEPRRRGYAFEVRPGSKPGAVRACAYLAVPEAAGDPVYCGDTTRRVCVVPAPDVRDGACPPCS